MEMNDYAKSWCGLSPYEQVKIGFMQNRNNTSGVGVAGLVTGVAGIVAAAGVGLWAAAKASQAREAAYAAKDVAAANNAGTAALLNRVATQYDQLFAAERAERIAGDVTLTNTVNDSVQGSQQGTLTAQQAAELSAVNSVMSQTFNDFVTGRASLNPTPVSLYSAPQPCSCPASCGCGCNG